MIKIALTVLGVVLGATVGVRLAREPLARYMSKIDQIGCVDE